MSEPTREERRWALIDQSQDYTPRWKVVNDRGPAASEYAEWVEVMPVAEPRGGQTWKRRADGKTVYVLGRRTVNPMAGVRPYHEDRWSVVSWEDQRGGGSLGQHEADFRAEFEFVSGTR